jgi:KAP family P-loop domain
MSKEAEIQNLKTQIKELNNELDILYKSKEEGLTVEEEYPEHSMSNQEQHFIHLHSLIDEKELEVREIEHNEEEKKRRDEIQKLSYENGFIIRDKESNVDFLSRAQQAQEISKLIANKQTLSPLTLGIYGPWGQGKSSFLSLIEKELNRINMEIKKGKNASDVYSKIHIVKFNASEYDDQDRIWFSMLNQLFAKFEEEVGMKAKIKYGLRSLIKSFRKNPWKYIVNVIVSIVFVVLFLVYFGDKSIEEIIKKNALYANLLGLISSITVATNIVIPLFKKISFATKPMSKKLIDHLKYPDYREALGTREKVKENLNDLIDIWLEERKEKIVITVDELDRCSEKTIVEFFKALQLFLSVESIIHIISINEETVSFALANNNLHYFDQEMVTNKEKLRFGQKYLEKYITIPFHLSFKEDYSAYINQLLRNNSSNMDEDNIFNEAEEDALIKIVNKINKNRFITPREIKKIINLLLLSKERLITFNKKDQEKLTVRFEEYIKWFLLEYFYSNTADYIIKYVEKNYSNNKLKNFEQITIFLNMKSEFQNIQVEENSKEIIQTIYKIRIEYILISNRIARNLISK